MAKKYDLDLPRLCKSARSYQFNTREFKSHLFAQLPSDRFVRLLFCSMKPLGCPNPFGPKAVFKQQYSSLGVYHDSRRGGL